MAKTMYKARGLGGRPPCLICMDPGGGARRPHELGHGLTIWLCAAHGSDEFKSRRAGRDFVVSVGTAWDAAGVCGRRYERALSAHLARVVAVGRARGLPGSYAWPDLRREAEARFGRGEPRDAVIRDLRTRHGVGSARVPSVYTMRRWHAEARWSVRDAAPARSAAPRA